jgi:hypothetical protein
MMTLIHSILMIYRKRQHVVGFEKHELKPYVIEYMHYFIESNITEFHCHAENEQHARNIFAKAVPILGVIISVYIDGMEDIDDLEEEEE